MRRNREEMIAMLESQVHHEALWFSRIPLLIGIVAAVVVCLGYASSHWTFMAVGLFVLIIGFSTQAVLWFGLRDLNRRR